MAWSWLEQRLRGRINLRCSKEDLKMVTFKANAKRLRIQNYLQQIVIVERRKEKAGQKGNRGKQHG